MRYFFHLGLAIFIAIIVGFGLSYLALERGLIYGTLRVGPWVAWSEMGSPDPDPYSRSFIARSGGLYLTKAEGIKFIATTDSNGDTLTLKCTYRIDGATPTATFWSLTATNETGGLVTRVGGETSMHSQRISRTEDGFVVVHIGQLLSSGNWLETQGDGPFQLVLTIYDSILFSNLGSYDGTLPSIIRERCLS